MKRKMKKLLATLLAATMLIGSMTLVSAAAGSTETVQVAQEVGYSGTTAPAYTFDSSSLTTGETVGAMVFNVTINLPAEGDVAWNDWCGEAIKVTAGDVVSYYDFGGAQVSWGTDLTGDDTPDTTGVGTDSWAGSVYNMKTATVVVPVNAKDFTVDFYDCCWDSATDIPHYTVNSATALYGEVASREVIEIGSEITYSGTTAPAYTLDSSSFTTQGNVSAVVMNVSVMLPSEGDVAWNDWCGAAAKVTAGDVVSYYDFGGSQVGWGTDLNGDDAPDTTGVGSSSWVGSAENGSISLVIPVNAEAFTIDLYDCCWDSAVDVAHLKVNSATALYGTVTSVAEPETPAEPEAPVVPEFDANATYNAYLQLQTPNWTFRDAWNDANGIGSENWGQWIKNNDSGETYGVVTDAVIDGNGTFTVKITDMGSVFADDFAAAGQEWFNIIGVTTDIPLTDAVKITNVETKMDGKVVDTQDVAYQNPDKEDYFSILVQNIWNSDKAEISYYAAPTTSLEISFTIEGFANDSASAGGDAATDAPSTDATTTPDASTNAPADNNDESGDDNTIIIIVVVAVVVVAAVAVAVVVSKKKKAK